MSLKDYAPKIRILAAMFSQEGSPNFKIEEFLEKRRNGEYVELVHDLNHLADILEDCEIDSTTNEENCDELN